MPSRSSSKTPKSSANKLSRSRRTPVAQSKSLRHNQRGFALLLVFLMAALVAITLYMELPRVAMESQRDKEQTLIDRGAQNSRPLCSSDLLRPPPGLPHGRLGGHHPLYGASPRCHGVAAR